MRGSQYCIFNRKYSKDEYLKLIAEYEFNKRSGVIKAKRDAEEFFITQPRRFANVLKSVNSTGNNLEETKSCVEAFNVFGGAEDCAYLYLINGGIKDSCDIDHAGLKSEQCFDACSVYPGSNIRFSRFMINCYDSEYSYNCHSSSNLFGCVGLRNKHYCILNVQYEKDEYQKLKEKIISHMSKIAYQDRSGRSVKYGEFFPLEFSPFAYNETVAQELFPLDSETARRKGIHWRAQAVKNYSPTVESTELPDAITEVDDQIIKEVIECEHRNLCKDQCSGAYRILTQELELYRILNVPLPALCPACRHKERLKLRNPIKLWKRQCSCKVIGHSHEDGQCKNICETVYSPEKGTDIYCESCYQKEVS